MKPSVIFIIGPTGVGKTYLSLLIAEKINIEIVSADSRQIYKYLDIGTAKPTKEKIAQVEKDSPSILKKLDTIFPKSKKAKKRKKSKK